MENSTPRQLIDILRWIYEEGITTQPDEVLKDSLNKYNSASMEYQAIQNIIDYRVKLRQEFIANL